MKRLLAIWATAAAIAAIGAVPALGGANAGASCVGIITSAEATQLPPGSVGQEVSGLAHAVQPLGSSLVGGLAGEHAGSIESCRAAEEG